jgi:hypothetical protein
MPDPASGTVADVPTGPASTRDRRTGPDEAGGGPDAAEPTTTSVPVCECGPPPTASASAPPREQSGGLTAPFRAAARAFGHLPWGARVTLGIALWAVVYHYWLPIVTWLFTDVLGLTEGRFASALEFFVYDTVKVLLLLTLVVFGVGIVRSFFSPQRTRSLLRGRRETTGNVMAAGLGTVTPFCSCSAVPLFIGFVEAGIPLGVTFSFLIAAPMVNEIALVLLYGLFGWWVAGLYLITGLLIAIVAGWIIGRLRMDHYVEDWVREIRMGDGEDVQELDWDGRVAYAWLAVRDIVGKVWLYVLAGIAVGAVIHGYVPEDFIAGIMGADAWWSVPLAVLLGIPMYSNAAGIIPIVEALLGKGAALGTVLAFMMAVIALSLPETIILKKVLKWPLIFTFLGVDGAGIMVVGFLFNAVLG